MRKILVFINAATAVAVIICLTVLLALPLAPVDDDVGIIGGTDGPTAIWLTNPMIAYVIYVLLCILLLANAYTLYKK
ncbi:MAG: hypothetical protein GX174_01005 [Lentisphaerae bacterium]|jgi:Na+-transporting methylmalonyl-CoA/oxaloacetate decarboxylase beta subunit|nr:hypothetical protein [Lentisphaerota bacterium]